MAVREIRGIYPGLLAQELPGIDIVKGVDDLPSQGKVTASGLVTVPVNFGYIGPTVSGDPLVSGDFPQDGLETREAAKLAIPNPPGAPSLGGLAIPLGAAALLMALL